MAKVVFTAHLRQVGPTEPQDYEGATVRDVLAATFREFPDLKGYIFDDRDRIRKHIAIFINGKRLDNHEAPDILVDTTTEIYVLQALSGG